MNQSQIDACRAAWDRVKNDFPEAWRVRHWDRNFGDAEDFRDGYAACLASNASAIIALEKIVLNDPYNQSSAGIIARDALDAIKRI